MMILVTGGAGFIGSHLVDLLCSRGETVTVLDKMTYAADRKNLANSLAHDNVELIEGSIEDKGLISSTLKSRGIRKIYNLAAESHVDNSIDDASPFVKTNVVGTVVLLNESLQYWEKIGKPGDFKLLHVSTDEVFGCLDSDSAPFNEETPYKPNSPYSASKAASDHFVRAWWQTYKLPCVITNCTNNYGPRQHKEKLIPTIIRNALRRNRIPIYGNGMNVRDWLYVKDHCLGLVEAMEKGVLGESYCFGGDMEITNIEIAHKVCAIVDELVPLDNGRKYSEQIAYVEDRKGHDWRYAVNCDKVERELNWCRTSNFDSSLIETCKFYVRKENYVSEK